LAALKDRHDKLLKHNDDLNHDIELHTKHLETLSIQNHELVGAIDHYHHNDEVMRDKIGKRQDFVNEVQDKHNDVMSSSLTNMKKSLKSPGKF